jgi:predicted AlkP superfamily pyrophosphatase or phosphodiesterase
VTLPQPRAAGLAGLAVLLAACAPSRPVPKVLVIGLDGVRPDILAAADTPTLDSLATAGYYAPRARTCSPTVSGPGWSSMLIGVCAAKHRVMSNDLHGNAYDRYPEFLTRIEQVRPALHTLAVLDWPPLGTTASGGPLVSDAVDRKLTFDGDSLEYGPADSLSVSAAAMALATTDVDAAFVYIGNPDEVAHQHGALGPEYRAAIARADQQVAELLRALRSRPNYAREDWLVLVSTDHGHRDEGGHGGTSPEEATIFYLASGPSVAAPAPDVTPVIVDVAATALTHLGIAIRPEWELDGKAVGLR